MKSLFLLVFAGVIGMTAEGQSERARDTEPVADTLAKEAFVDTIYRTIVDGGFAHYLLVGTAHPVSMVKYDYDEWVKYALQEEVSIQVLNELAKKALEHREAQEWQAGQLMHVRCVPPEKSDSVLGAGLGKRQFLRWEKLPAQDRTVFNFSYPLFTDDGQYALIDLDKHCDPRQCGVGMTCLYRKTAAGWKLVGRMVRWGQ
jgi:hypothetical protein